MELTPIDVAGVRDELDDDFDEYDSVTFLWDDMGDLYVRLKVRTWSGCSWQWFFTDHEPDDALEALNLFREPMAR